LQHVNNLLAGDQSLMPKPSIRDDNECTQKVLYATQINALYENTDLYSSGGGGGIPKKMGGGVGGVFF